MNANSIPAAFWFLLEIVNDQTLLKRVRKEVEASLESTSTNESPEFDMRKLSSSPLMQSIWAETLRLRVSLNIVRGTEYRDFKLGNWLIPQGRTIAIPSRAAHMDESVWSTGSGETIHPLNEFWADRFLIHPNIAGSGPSRQSSLQKNNSAPVHGDILPKQATFSLENLRGAFVPFGGGNNICPGRHFAKHEMMFSLALLSTLYDIEPDKGTANPEADLRHYGHGTLPPKGQVPFRIRRRQIFSEAR